MKGGKDTVTEVRRACDASYNDDIGSRWRESGWIIRVKLLSCSSMGVRNSDGGVGPLV